LEGDTQKFSNPNSLNPIPSLKNLPFGNNPTELEKVPSPKFLKESLGNHPMEITIIRFAKPLNSSFGRNFPPI